ncbi:hypothetical protein ACP4OV_004789 [Aristida adscensionis]
MNCYFSLRVTTEVKDSLVKNMRRRMTPQPLKIRADIKMRSSDEES